jgi:hypothetical protein
MPRANISLKLPKLEKTTSIHTSVTESPRRQETLGSLDGATTFLGIATMHTRAPNSRVSSDATRRTETQHHARNTRVFSIEIRISDSQL